MEAAKPRRGLHAHTERERERRRDEERACVLSVAGGDTRWNSRAAERIRERDVLFNDNSDVACEPPTRNKWEVRMSLTIWPFKRGDGGACASYVSAGPNSTRGGAFPIARGGLDVRRKYVTNERRQRD